MLRICLAVFLIAGICVYTTPIQAQQTSEEVQAAFEAELTEYAATHSDDELRAYAATRMSELTDQGLWTETVSPIAAVISPEVWYGESSVDDRPGDKWIGDPIDPGFWDGDLYKSCLNARYEECRRNYNADLFTSAAVSTAIAAGCVGLTGGSGLIICLALALAAHAAGIAAAKERYQGCRTRAQFDCRTQAGG
jgi:hypothetical protein